MNPAEPVTLTRDEANTLVHTHCLKLEVAPGYDTYNHATGQRGIHEAQWREGWDAYFARGATAAFPEEFVAQLHLTASRPPDAILCREPGTEPWRVAGDVWTDGNLLWRLVDLYEIDGNHWRVDGGLEYRTVGAVDPADIGRGVREVHGVKDRATSIVLCALRCAGVNAGSIS